MENSKMKKWSKLPVPMRCTLSFIFTGKFPARWNAKDQASRDYLVNNLKEAFERYDRFKVISTICLNEATAESIATSTYSGFMEIDANCFTEENPTLDWWIHTIRNSLGKDSFYHEFELNLTMVKNVMYAKPKSAWKQEPPRIVSSTEDHAKHMSIVLSKRAQDMYKRLCKSQHFYTWEKYRNSPIMHELLVAGLVTHAGRMQTVVKCYVPRHGYIPMQHEVFVE
jgi:hypothetical protein